jgi:hypothetical protein
LSPCLNETELGELLKALSGQDLNNPRVADAIPLTYKAQGRVGGG